MNIETKFELIEHAIKGFVPRNNNIEDWGIEDAIVQTLFSNVLALGLAP